MKFHWIFRYENLSQNIYNKLSGDRVIPDNLLFIINRSSLKIGKMVGGGINYPM